MPQPTTPYLPSPTYHPLPSPCQAEPNRVEVVGYGSGGLPQCLAAAAAPEACLYGYGRTYYGYTFHGHSYYGVRPTYFGAYYALLTTHYSLLTTHYSLLTTHCSLLATRYSLLATRYSLLTAHCLLLTTAQARLYWGGLRVVAVDARRGVISRRPKFVFFMLAGPAVPVRTRTRGLLDMGAIAAVLQVGGKSS